MPKYQPMSSEIYQYILEKRLPYSKGNYLEIGSYTGGGITLLAEHFPNKNFYSIESFVQESDNSVEKFIENTKDLDNIKLIYMNSLIFNKFLIFKSKIFDINDMNIDTILIDGSHIYKDVLIDIDTSILLLKNKIGFIFFHDAINTKDVVLAVDEFENNYKNQFYLKILMEMQKFL